MNTMSDRLYDILTKVCSKSGGFPKSLSDKLTIAQKATRTGGRETSAFRVKIGEADIFFQYNATISETDTTPEAVRFRRDLSFDIPQLSNGKAVRYYVNKNIGCRSWNVFIKSVRDLESRAGEFISDELERHMRQRD